MLWWHRGLRSLQRLSPRHTAGGCQREFAECIHRSLVSTLVPAGPGGFLPMISTVPVRVGSGTLGHGDLNTGRDEAAKARVSPMCWSNRRTGSHPAWLSVGPRRLDDDRPGGKVEDLWPCGWYNPHLLPPFGLGSGVSAG